MGAEDPINVAFVAMSLYFLRTFICAFNNHGIGSEARITMLWSSSMRSTYLNGIHAKSLNNFSTACIDGVFWQCKKRVKNSRTTTTEPLEHMFGTTHSWKREFIVNDFIIFSNKLELIMNNVMKNDIKTGTLTKGYMTGFSGFVEVVRKMKTKLKKEIFIGDEVSVAVDVNYNQSIARQIEPGLIGIINRSQGPMLHLMETFNITENSQYCYPITSILDICKCYIDSNRNANTLLQPINDISYLNLVNEQKVVQRLAILHLTLTVCAFLQQMNRMSISMKTHYKVTFYMTVRMKINSW